jgi:tRNA pseudouridine65 synthase
VHHSHQARNLTETVSLVEWLRDTHQQVAFPVHRLDHKTSGIVLFCKDTQHVSAFQNLFDTQQIEKKYLALVRGHIFGEGIINSPVKNERGNYKAAETHYKSIEHYTLEIAVEPYPTSRYSLIEFTPKTGRTHQLRIHANKLAHPIIGDPKHGNRHHNHMFEEQLQLPNLFLHAHRLSFIHPFTQERIFLEAPLPEFWEQFFLTTKVG